MVALRDALKLKGKIEQVEGKAKFSKDKSLIETEEHIAAKAKYAELYAATKGTVDKISSQKRFSRQKDDDTDEEVVYYGGYSLPQRGNRRVGGDEGGA